MPIKILVVEDEPQVASVVKRSLEEEGYEITVAPDGNIAWQQLQNFTYNLLVFDLMLPGINGLQLCKQCRQSAIKTPILLLTALGSTDNIVTGLDSGADDYLTKPFKLAELLARVRSLLRRSTTTAPRTETAENEKKFAALTLNLDEKIARYTNRKIDLTVTEFRLLDYFMRNPKKVLSRVDILSDVWGYDISLNTKVVDVYVNYLRKKLESDGEPRLIHTVVGMGYILKEGPDETAN